MLESRRWQGTRAPTRGESAAPDDVEAQLAAVAEADYGPQTQIVCF